MTNLDCTDVRLPYVDQLTLAQAVEVDHDCNDAGCMVAAALRAGFPEVAAWSLSSATELDATAQALETLDIYGGHSLPRGFNEWSEWHEEHGRLCSDCGAYTYADDHDPTECACCLAVLPIGPEED